MRFLRTTRERSELRREEKKTRKRVDMEWNSLRVCADKVNAFNQTEFSLGTGYLGERFFEPLG
jgi:hypothetical protein